MAVRLVEGGLQSYDPGQAARTTIKKGTVGATTRKSTGATSASSSTPTKTPTPAQTSTVTQQAEVQAAQKTAAEQRLAALTAARSRMVESGGAVGRRIQSTDVKTGERITIDVVSKGGKSIVQERRGDKISIREYGTGRAGGGVALRGGVSYEITTVNAPEPIPAVPEFKVDTNILKGNFDKILIGKEGPLNLRTSQGFQYNQGSASYNLKEFKGPFKVDTIPATVREKGPSQYEQLKQSIKLSGGRKIGGTLDFLASKGQVLYSKAVEKNIFTGKRTGNIATTGELNLAFLAGRTAPYFIPGAGNLLLVGEGTENIIAGKNWKEKGLGVIEVGLGGVGVVSSTVKAARLRDIKALEKATPEVSSSLVKGANTRFRVVTTTKKKADSIFFKDALKQRSINIFDVIVTGKKSVQVVGGEGRVIITKERFFGQPKLTTADYTFFGDAQKTAASIVKVPPTTSKGADVILKGNIRTPVPTNTDAFVSNLNVLRSKVTIDKTRFSFKNLANFEKQFIKEGSVKPLFQEAYSTQQFLNVKNINQFQRAESTRTFLTKESLFKKDQSFIFYSDAVKGRAYFKDEFGNIILNPSKNPAYKTPGIVRAEFRPSGFGIVKKVKGKLKPKFDVIVKPSKTKDFNTGLNQVFKLRGDGKAVSESIVKDELLGAVSIQAEESVLKTLPKPVSSPLPETKSIFSLAPRIETVATKQRPVQVSQPKVETSQTTSNSQATRTSFGFVNIQEIKTGQLGRQGTRTEQLIKQDNINDVLSRQTQRTDFSQEQVKSKKNLTEKIFSKPVITPPQVPPLIPPIEPPIEPPVIFGLPKPKAVKSGRSGRLFQVQVRRQGKFRTVGLSPTLKGAFAIGRQKVSQTLAATFTIPGARSRSVKGFRTKEEKGRILFIEPRGKRLKRGTKEVPEINFYRGLRR